MSTLGDLLAEHTMLPGNAVDHLHAVVGEWQLLADLSFADYLMWVRRAVFASGGRRRADDDCAGAFCTVLPVDAAWTLAGYFQSRRRFVVPISTAPDARSRCMVSAFGAGMHLAGRRTRSFAMGHGYSIWSGAVAGSRDSVL